MSGVVTVETCVVRSRTASAETVGPVRGVPEKAVRGPYVTVEKDGKMQINLTVPVELHDHLMRLLVATTKNPNRSEWIRQAIREKLTREDLQMEIQAGGTKWNGRT